MYCTCAFSILPLNSNNAPAAFARRVSELPVDSLHRLISGIETGCGTCRAHSGPYWMRSRSRPWPASLNSSRIQNVLLRSRMTANRPGANEPPGVFASQPRSRRCAYWSFDSCRAGRACTRSSACKTSDESYRSAVTISSGFGLSDRVSSPMRRCASPKNSCSWDGGTPSSFPIDSKYSPRPLAISCSRLSRFTAAKARALYSSLSKPLS